MLTVPRFVFRGPKTTKGPCSTAPFTVTMAECCILPKAPAIPSAELCSVHILLTKIPFFMVTLQATGLPFGSPSLPPQNRVYKWLLSYILDINLLSHSLLLLSNFQNQPIQKKQAFSFYFTFCIKFSKRRD